MNDYTIFYCPHCAEPFLVYHVEINCSIFRHGAFRHNDQQISPHASKEECDRLFSEGLIYGCGKPFRIIKRDDDYIVEVCDYI